MVPFGSGTVGVGETSFTGAFSFETSLEGDSCFGTVGATLGFSSFKGDLSLAVLTVSFFDGS